MKKSRFKGEWLWILQYGDEAPTKYRVLSTFQELGINFYRMVTECNHIVNIPADSIQNIGELKKAKVLNYKKKLRLLK